MTSYFTDNLEEKETFDNWLSNAKNIVVTSHQNPDGDAFGSGLGLTLFLKNIGYENTVFISPTDYADFLSWMPGVSDILVYEYIAKEKGNELLKNADIIFCLDFSAAARVKEMTPELLASPAKKIIIDHHEQPEAFADLIFWNEKASSTCELVYQFIEKLGHSQAITSEVATCLYTGLLTDTGSFRFESTTAEVHRIVGGLINHGAVPNNIYRSLFDNNTPERLKFLGYALSKKMTYLPEFRTCYFVITEAELKKYNSKSGDTEGVVNYGLSIAGVVMSVIFIEKEDMVKMSLRSVDNFSVAEMARNHFQGGGHKNASGGRSLLTLEETVDKFLNLLPYYKKEILLQPN